MEERAAAATAFKAMDSDSSWAIFQGLMAPGHNGLVTTLGRGCVAVCGGSHAMNGAGGGSVVDLVVRQQVDSQRRFEALTAKCAGVRLVTSNAALVVSFLLRGGSLALTSKLWLAALAPALDFISVASNLEAAAAGCIKPAADEQLDLEQLSSAMQERSADPAFLQVLTQQGNHVRNSLVLTGERGFLAIRGPRHVRPS